MVGNAVRTAVFSEAGSRLYEDGDLLQEFVGECDPMDHKLAVPCKYMVRVDPLSGNISKISEARAEGVRKVNTGINVILDMSSSGPCLFCNYERETPLDPEMEMGRIIHRKGDEILGVTCRNLFPWERSQYVTIYPPFDQEKTGHRMLSELEFSDVVAMGKTQRDVADHINNLRKKYPQKCIKSNYDFTNWGAFAGGSVQHPHSQRGFETVVMDPVTGEPVWNRVVQREMERCMLFYRRNGVNMFEAMMEQERYAGKRLIHEDGTFITASFAPKSSDEILVIPHLPATHVLQMGEGDIEKMMRSVLGVFNGLFFYRGVCNLNIVCHMAPFDQIDESTPYYRMHMHIYPRKGSLPVHVAGAEFGNETYVSGVWPEYTAEKIRSWYTEGPRREMVVDNPAILERFDRKYVKRTV